jgi:hypothetical protein
MYSEEIISTIANRIGFGVPKEESFGLTISEANSSGTSGRIFSSFHSLVTIENIFSCTRVILPNADGSSEAFNAELENFRQAAAREILPLIVDKNSQYDLIQDYSQKITDNIILFDDALGYKVAIKVLEYCMSSTRINQDEINVNLSASKLLLDINGYIDNNGKLQARGLVHELKKSIQTATNLLFPVYPTIQDGNAW